MLKPNLIIRVNASRKLGGLILIENQKSREDVVEQEPDQILHNLVGFVC